MMFPIDSLHKWHQLPPQERRLLVQAWAALHVIYAALRILPFDIILAACQRVRSVQRPARKAPASALRLVWMMDVASRHSLVTTTCLNQALALSWLMGRLGMPSTLRIGVTRSTGHLAAHAWIEQDGHIIMGASQAEAYTPLFPVRPFEGHPS